MSAAAQAREAPVSAITGASGYVGSRVAKALAEAGYTPVTLGRRPSDVPWSLSDDVSARTFSDRRVEALVHCAYDFRPRTRQEIYATNVEGTRRLFSAARAAGVGRIVHLSTTAAFPGARSIYGQAKLETENLAREANAFVVRPGLVCGDEPGGMVGTLAGLLRRSPVVPIVGGERTTFTVQDDELALLIVRLVRGELDGQIVPRYAPIVAATEQGITLRALLDRIAAREGRRVVWVPVPSSLVWASVKSLEVLHVPISLRSDSLVSFMSSNLDLDFTQTRRTGMTFRPFTA